MVDHDKPPHSQAGGGFRRNRMDTTNLFRLDGRTALVTGGSRGIGRMIAAGFIAQGATVYISSRKAEACFETAKELGEKCIALPQDVSTVAGCKALAAQ